MRAGTVVELADRYGVELPEGLRDGRYDFRDFRHFIDEWVAVLACLRTPEDFRRIAVEFCEDEAARGVRYAEVSFSLPDHAERFEDWEGPMLGVLEGFEEGERRFGLACRMVVDVVRGIDMELSRRAMEVASAFGGAGVIGIGLGGEERYPPEPYAGIFREGRARGLHAIPHAGETHGPASIRGAVEALGAERIGHGIRVLEDSALVDEVRERGIAFDVCPTSNAKTRSVASLEAHPLGAMLDAGLLCTLASDDPSMFHSGIADEYEVCRSALGFDDARLALLARNGVRASFADPRAKADLDRAIDAWVSGSANG
jgi:adenosine deaminase